MKKIAVAPGVELSEISLGAGSRGAEKDEALVFSIMDRYVEAGGTTIDSARLYADGRADAALGKWLGSRSNRDRIVIVSKGSYPVVDATHVSRLSPAEIGRDIDESLAAMGVPYSDLHLLHRDDVRIPVGEIMRPLDALVRAGKTRAVGVSNWTVSRIAEANGFAAENGLAPITCCQMHYSLAQTTAAATGDITHVPMSDVEYAWYKETGLPVMAFGVQAHGWFAKRAAGGDPKGFFARYYDYFPENHRRLERLVRLSRETGKTLSALTTAYARDSGLNVSPLCAFSSIAQLEECLDALTFTLTPDQVRYLESGGELK